MMGESGETGLPGPIGPTGEVGYALPPEEVRATMSLVDMYKPPKPQGLLYRFLIWLGVCNE
jgi:hypothetical protein